MFYQPFFSREARKLRAIVITISTLFRSCSHLQQWQPSQYAFSVETLWSIELALPILLDIRTLLLREETYRSCLVGVHHPEYLPDQALTNQEALVPILPPLELFLVLIICFHVLETLDLDSAATLGRFHHYQCMHLHLRSCTPWVWVDIDGAGLESHRICGLCMGRNPWGRAKGPRIRGIDGVWSDWGCCPGT